MLSRCLTFSNTHPHNLSPRLSPLLLSPQSIIQMSNVLSLPQRVDGASIILRGRVLMMEGREPHAFSARSSGLEGCQSTETQALALCPAAGFWNSLPSPPDLSRFHVSQHQAAFPVGILSLVCSCKCAVDEKREDVLGGNGQWRHR